MSRRIIVPVVAALMASFAFPALPAAATEPCEGGDGRITVTAEGFLQDFTGPAMADPLSGEGVPVPWQPASLASFDLRLDLSPYSVADVSATLSWANESDFDLYVQDAEGNEVASSAKFNPVEGTGEALSIEGVTHCTDLTVLVHNYLGLPDTPMALDVDVSQVR